jgi:hypothetical protein
MIGTILKGYEPDIVTILILPEAHDYHLTRFLGEIKTLWMGTQIELGQGGFRHLIG